MLSPLGKQRVLALCGSLSTTNRCGIPGITEVTRGRWCVNCLKSLAKALNEFNSSQDKYTDVTTGIMFYYMVVASEVSRNLGKPLANEVSALWEKDSMTLNNPVYLAWSHMMDKCYDPSNPNYQAWGAKGYTVDEEWHDFARFSKDFPDGAAHVGVKPGRMKFSKANVHWNVNKVTK